MGNIFDVTLALRIPVASITVADLMTATGAVKLLEKKDIKWEKVINRLIEELKNFKSSNRTRHTDFAIASCAICLKHN